MINVNLKAGPLIHCLKLSDAKSLIVDGDEKCLARIELSREAIERDLMMQISVLDDSMKSHVNTLPAVAPGDEYRGNLSLQSSSALLYTR